MDQAFFAELFTSVEKLALEQMKPHIARLEALEIAFIALLQVLPEGTIEKLPEMMETVRAHHERFDLIDEHAQRHLQDRLDLLVGRLRPGP